MCASPYDYCGPTFTGDNGHGCHPRARANSRLSPPLEATHVEPAPAEQIIQQGHEAAPAELPKAGNQYPDASASQQPTPARPTPPASRWTARPRPAER